MPKKETKELGEKKLKKRQSVKNGFKEKSEPETQTNLINTKPKDSSAKLIFGDPILCAQFLRDFMDIPMLKDVQPEDITDVTNRYVHMFTNERDSDIVKKIYIKSDETPFYLISLIEHKSKVDYNVVMQVFRYMAFIWEDYEKDMEKQHEGITKLKGFRYPPIIPIVFYDGDENWTAATRLRDRVSLSDVFKEFIPDYRCLLMQLKDYSSADLMEKNNELSVLFQLDRINNAEDFEEMKKTVSDKYLEAVTETTPEYLLVIMAQIIGTQLENINVPHEEAEKFKEQIKERTMGEMFRYFKGWDVQALRKEADEREQKAWDKAYEKAHEEAYEEGIGKLIKAIKSVGSSRITAMQQLMEQYGLDEAEADEKIALYW